MRDLRVIRATLAPKGLLGQLEPRARRGQRVLLVIRVRPDLRVWMALMVQGEQLGQQARRVLRGQQVMLAIPDLPAQRALMVWMVAWVPPAQRGLRVVPVIPVYRAQPVRRGRREPLGQLEPRARQVPREPRAQQAPQGPLARQALQAPRASMDLMGRGALPGLLAPGLQAQPEPQVRPVQQVPLALPVLLVLRAPPGLPA